MEWLIAALFTSALKWSVGNADARERLSERSIHMKQSRSKITVVVGSPLPGVIFGTRRQSNVHPAQLDLVFEVWRPSRRAKMMIETSEKLSLYERLGGVYGVATVVEDLIDRVMVDPRLNANPLVDEAHHRNRTVWLAFIPAGFSRARSQPICRSSRP